VKTSNKIHTKNCLHRGMWNGQQYDRSLGMLMRSVTTSRNNMIKKKTCLSPSLIVDHSPGIVTDLPLVVYLHLWLLPLIYSQKSDDVVLLYFIYLHASKSLFIYPPFLQTTVYVPHSCTKLLWRHFIKKDVTSCIYASITPHL
jgi:hypothetical protein